MMLVVATHYHFVVRDSSRVAFRYLQLSSLDNFDLNRIILMSDVSTISSAHSCHMVFSKMISCFCYNRNHPPTRPSLNTVTLILSMRKVPQSTKAAYTN